MTKPTMLFIMGGLRVGDTFHTIPFLKQACKKFYIAWIHGTYEQQAAEAIQTAFKEIDIGERYILDDGMPTDLGSIEQFYPKGLEYAKNRQLDYDVIESSTSIITSANSAFTLESDIHTLHVDASRRDDSIVTLKDELLGLVPGFSSDKVNSVLDRLPKTPFIAVQATTCSEWKVIQAIFDIKLPYPIVSLGKVGERIVPGSIDMRGLDLVQGGIVLSKAAAVVAQHSAIGVYSFYLGRPTVIIHFFKEGLFEFGLHHKNCIDLKIPSAAEIESAVERLLNPSVDLRS